MNLKSLVAELLLMTPANALYSRRGDICRDDIPVRSEQTAGSAERVWRSVRSAMQRRRLTRAMLLRQALVLVTRKQLFFYLLLIFMVFVGKFGH